METETLSEETKVQYRAELIDALTGLGTLTREYLETLTYEQLMEIAESL